MEGNCVICDKKIKITMCCGGHECGCMGMPLEPPVCSNECFEEYEKILFSENKLETPLDDKCDEKKKTTKRENE